ncbi:MAG: 1-acyl-sn-glycerol-3-phosphate acyltransferase [Myxococcales bacterium]|nr:1-acyl-sn-glycerol-3-phosphate acyltransferase [Myxococcales bacterium]
MRALISWLRLSIGFVYCAGVVGVMMIGCLALLPFGRTARIHLTNRLGKVLGRGILAISGSKVTVHGEAYARMGCPVIFANNHTSNLDAFLTIWLMPLGTVGLAKKQIIYYPLYGQAWLLSGHPTVDRSHPQRARQSMTALGALVHRHNLSVCMLPEGTRSRSGRLQPFKKGIAHLAIQTGLPIVPMVTIGAHGAWNRGQWTLQTRDIHVHFLPPIDTNNWSVETLDQHLDELQRQFVVHLPPDMRPIDGSPRPQAA